MNKIIFILMLSLLVSSGGYAQTGPVAVAVITPIKANTVQGTVRFVPLKVGMDVYVSLTGLKPGSHGFHIHALGDISKPDGSSVGGHFNPSKHHHGGPEGDDHHMGDLGNLMANASGNVDSIVTVVSGLSFSGTSNIIGRSVVIHADTDDFASQPAGKSGERVGWGVIGIAKE